MQEKLWIKIRNDASKVILREPQLSCAIDRIILNHDSLEASIAYHLSQKISSDVITAEIIEDVCLEAFSANQKKIVKSIELDLLAILDRDPACNSAIQPILFFKGFLALQAYRVSNWLWNKNRVFMAQFIQSRLSEEFSVDIHPNAKVGDGIMIDHAHSIVIGETSVVGNNVSILHSVTLGGTGKEEKKRHPTIEDGVLIGAGAKILGGIKIGYCSKIASGSVVLKSIPPKKTAAGVPARVVGDTGCFEPSITMDQLIKEN